MNYIPSKNELIEFEKNFNAADFLAVEKKACYFIENGFHDLRIINYLAIAYAKQKKYYFAEQQFLKLIEYEPYDFDHLFNLANLYRENKKYDQAINYFINALNLRPKSKKTLLVISALYFKKKNFDKAILFLGKLLKDDEFDKEALSQMGSTLVNMGRFEEALNFFNKIGRKYGYNKGIYGDISVCYINLGHLNTALKINKLAGNTDNAIFNRSIINLKKGRFLEGWQGYEHGLKNKSRLLKLGHHKFDYLPNWNPKIHKDSVLLIGEQGIGDELMFSIMIEDLYSVVKNIYYFCDERLRDILKKRYPMLNFVDENSPKLIVEAKIPIGSLGKFFRNNEEDFLTKYEKTKIFKNNKIIKKNNKKLIGLSWHTNNKQFGTERNINLKEFSNIFKNKDLNFINLQYGYHSDEIFDLKKKLEKEIFIENKNDNKNDLQGLSNNISNCDYVITIDNSTAHLAGFLNIKTYLLLSKVNNWRWIENRRDTPWYPNTKLIIQEKKNCWVSVINQLEEELEI
tara:strand:+ start:10470 stop:12011 length:1542 start_codon:yes stop_codon:yes gene_type:complete